MDGSNSGDNQLYPIVVNYFSASTNEIESSVLAVPVLERDGTGKNIGCLIKKQLEKRKHSFFLTVLRLLLRQ